MTWINDFAGVAVDFWSSYMSWNSWFILAFIVWFGLLFVAFVKIKELF